MNTRPLGVTILALILAISGVVQVIVGTDAAGITSFGIGDAATDAGISGYASIISGALSLLVGAGLFTLAGWAHTLVTVVLLIRILADGYAIFAHGATSTAGYAAIGNLVISLIGLWYFQRATVKAAFGK